MMEGALEGGLMENKGALFAMLAVIFVGIELFNRALPIVFGPLLGFEESIPGKGKHLDVLNTKSIVFISFNRLTILPFFYHIYCFCAGSENVDFGTQSLNLSNTLLALCAMFLAYDSVYHPFHRLLHWKPLYPYVHKHHHQQMVPTRGNLDAVNVHPFEFVVGEYMHIFAMWFVSSFLFRIHLFSIIAFVFIGGVVASMNHSRFDILWPGIIGIRYHDIHHSVYPFNLNYSQYTVLWDRFYGTFVATKEVRKK